MRIYDLIAKKRDGGTHSREELEACKPVLLAERCDQLTRYILNT